MTWYRGKLSWLGIENSSSFLKKLEVADLFNSYEAAFYFAPEVRRRTWGVLYSFQSLPVLTSSSSAESYYFSGLIYVISL